MKALKRLLEMPFSGRQSRLAASRPTMSNEQFVKAVASSDLGRQAANALWAKLIEARVDDQFTPYPYDNLLQVFGLADEDLDEDVILDIIQEVGSKVPTSEAMVQFGSVDTPADIVRLIEYSN